MRSISFIFIIVICTCFIVHNASAGAFVESGGSCYSFSTAALVGAPDGWFTTVDLFNSIGCALYFDQSSIPDLENGYEIRFYTGPLFTETTNFKQGCVMFRVRYSNGSYITRSTDTQEQDCQVITCSMLPVPVGVTIARIDIWAYGSAYPPWFPYHLDAVEILDSDQQGGECEIVSVTFDQAVYQNGVDVANMTVVTLNSSEDITQETLVLNVEPRIGIPFDQEIIQNSLNPGTFSVTNSIYQIPEECFSIVYDADVDLTSDNCTENIHLNSAFIGTTLSPEQIQQYQEQINQSFINSNSEYPEYIGNLVPLCHDLSHATIFVDDMCIAGYLYQSEETKGESWAALSSGMKVFGHLLADGLLAAYAHAPITVLYIDISPGIEFLKKLWAAMWLENYYYTGSAMISDRIGIIQNEGTLVDSLAVHIPEGFDATQGDFSDALLIEGQCDVMLEADSSWAAHDSTGLVGVYFSTLDTVGTVTIVPNNVYRFYNTELSNLHSASVFRISNCTSPVIDIGLLHYSETDSLMYFRYPYVSVTSQSNLSIEVADTLDIVVVQCDYDGDGEVDYDIYPVEITDSDDPQMPIPSGLKITNIPNPFNPSTSILYELPHSGNVRIDIYDVAGRRVKALVDEIHDAGKFEATWDGRDTNGSIATSGVYFVKLALAGDSVTRKIVLLR